MKILNLTQHPTTREQEANGVVDLSPKKREQLVELLTFDEIPSNEELLLRAYRIVALAKKVNSFDGVMLGGATFFMPPLERAFRKSGIPVYYAFSKRESVETVLPNGETVKKSVFRHAGFVVVGE